MLFKFSKAHALYEFTSKIDWICETICIKLKLKFDHIE